jgi:hypothetical protein
LKNNKYIKKISDYTMVGGLGALLVVGLVGCDDASSSKPSQGQSDAFTNASQKEGAFVIIEESADGKYKIADEFPSAKTTIVLRKPDGSERILTQEEIDKLVKEEEKKIDAGTSALTNPNAEVAMIGSWLGNKLFNNQNFQNQKAAQYKSPQTYSKSQSSFNKPSSTAGAGKQSGFFGGNNQNSSQSNNTTKSTTQSTGG